MAGHWIRILLCLFLWLDVQLTAQILADRTDCNAGTTGSLQGCALIQLNAQIWWKFIVPEDRIAGVEDTLRNCFWCTHWCVISWWCTAINLWIWRLDSVEGWGAAGLIFILEEMIKLWNICDDWKFIWFIIFNHILRIQESWQSKFFFSNSISQPVIFNNILSFKALKINQIWPKVVNDGTKS